MASGHARVVSEKTGKRVQIVDVDGLPRWDDLWHGLPWIARPYDGGDLVKLRNGPGCRPYLEYPWSVRTGQRFTSWRARDHVGSLELRADELRFADEVAAELGEFVVIEPSISTKSNLNKQWSPRSWRQLSQILQRQGIKVVQLAPHPVQCGDGVAHVRTRTFRHAAAVLRHARLAILPEGGLHHAAGVLDVPAVVLFGGTISPQTTGYELHVNLADNAAPCGSWSACKHCEQIWQNLTPESVAEIAREQFNARRAA